MADEPRFEVTRESLGMVIELVDQLNEAHAVALAEREVLGASLYWVMYAASHYALGESVIPAATAAMAEAGFVGDPRDPGQSVQRALERLRALNASKQEAGL